MINKIKLDLKKLLENFYLEKYNSNISIIVEEPKNSSLGDISIPLFTVVKTLRRPMPELVNEAVEVINSCNLPILSVSNVGSLLIQTSLFILPPPNPDLT